MLRCSITCMGCKGSRVQISALRPVKTNSHRIFVAKPVAKYKTSVKFAGACTFLTALTDASGQVLVHLGISGRRRLAGGQKTDKPRSTHVLFQAVSRRRRE
jgi:hypothetical protein